MGETATQRQQFKNYAGDNFMVFKAASRVLTIM